MPISVPRSPYCRAELFSRPTSGYWMNTKRTERGWAARDRISPAVNGAISLHQPAQAG
jgi:hypothetical protein